MSVSCGLSRKSALVRCTTVTAPLWPTTPSSARRPTPLATERYQPPLCAAIAGKYGEASAEQTAVEVVLELAPHELRQGRGEALLGRSVKRLQIFTHHTVQSAELGATPLVGVAAGADGDRHASVRSRTPCRAAIARFGVLSEPHAAR